MAHTVTKRHIGGGNYRTWYHITLLSDGASGELSDQVLIDPVTDLTDKNGNPLTSKARPFVESIEYNFAGFNAKLEFEYLVSDNLVWVLGREQFYHDFLKYGGLLDPSAVDGTGKIMISTVDFGNAGSMGSIILKISNG